MEFVRFNKTCAFHVHVGSESDGFSLRALQKLASLLLVGGEELLDKVHPKHRVGAASCGPIRSKTFLASVDLQEREPTGDLAENWFGRCAPEDTPPNAGLRSQLNRIWRAKNVDEFCRLLDARGDEKPAYGFVGLSPPDAAEGGDRGKEIAIAPAGSQTDQKPKTYKPTIEFREGDADVARDKEYHVAWVRVVTRLVRWAAYACEWSLEDAARVARKGVSVRESSPEAVAALLREVLVVEKVVEVMESRAAALEIEEKMEVLEI